MKSMSMSRIWFRARSSAADMFGDRSGVAATEFAMIVPLMLVLFFGVIEFSSGVAIDRKVTLAARTLTDLTSQATPPTPGSLSASVADTDLLNAFTASIAILSPYSPTPTTATISEIYIDSNNKATIQWSKAATIASGATQATFLPASTYIAKQDVTSIVPTTLLIKQTYVILSEVKYTYTPTVSYVALPASVALKDVAYSRPRQVVCLTYVNSTTPDSTCPTP
jgi:Flp pilus assembly protein TadG